MMFTDPKMHMSIPIVNIDPFLAIYQRKFSFGQTHKNWGYPYEQWRVVLVEESQVQQGTAGYSQVQPGTVLKRYDSERSLGDH